MSELPYDVNEWIPTEELLRRFEERFESFRPTANEKIHFVDIMGRLVPRELADEIEEKRARGAGLLRTRDLIQSHLGVARDKPNRRAVWATVLLLGFSTT